MRVAAILEEYEDSRIDFVDASVMAVAERFGSTAILTLDQRDFRLFRPRHCDHFEILPCIKCQLTTRRSHFGKDQPDRIH